MSKKKNEPAPEPEAPAAVAEAAPEEEAAEDVPPEPPPPEPEVAAELAPQPAAVEAEPVRYFLVKAFSKYCFQGAVYSLHAGTIVTTLTHDLKDVRAQGVPLEEISADQVPGPRALVQ